MFDNSKYIWKRESWLKGCTFFISFVQVHCFIVQCLLFHASTMEVYQIFLLAHCALQPYTLFRLWREISDFSKLCMVNQEELHYGWRRVDAVPFITEIIVFTQSYLKFAVQLLGDDEPKLANDSLTNIEIFTYVCCWIRICILYLNYMCMSNM